MKKVSKSIEVIPTVWDNFLKSIDRRKKREGVPSLPISNVMAEMMKEHSGKW